MYCYKLPHSIVQYLCFALISTVVILILSLVRMSFVSTKRLELGEVVRPMPAPQWTEFPLLTRYYAGIRTVVSRTDNVPEYPSPGGDAQMPNATETRPAQGFPSTLRFDTYPDYASDAYISEYGPVEDCIAGTNVSRLARGTRAYLGVPSGFPEAVMGA